MAICVPENADIAQDQRLTTIALIEQLSVFVEGKQGLKAQLKNSLAEQNAQFVESELAIGRFTPGGKGRQSVSPQKLWRLVKAGKLTEKQFVECSAIRREPLEQYLSGQEIDAISEAGEPTSGALKVEIKNVQYGPDDIAEIAQLLAEKTRGQKPPTAPAPA